jgi:hypothetical protein
MQMDHMVLVEQAMLVLIALFDALVSGGVVGVTSDAEIVPNGAPEPASHWNEKGTDAAGASDPAAQLYVAIEPILPVPFSVHPAGGVKTKPAVWKLSVTVTFTFENVLVLDTFSTRGIPLVSIHTARSGDVPGTIELTAAASLAVLENTNPVTLSSAVTTFCTVAGASGITYIVAVIGGYALPGATASAREQVVVVHTQPVPPIARTLNPYSGFSVTVTVPLVTADPLLVTTSVNWALV